MSHTQDVSDLLLEIDQLVSQQEYQKASLVFKKIFEAHPNEPLALRKLASLIFQLGQQDAAISMLADSIDSEDPDPETVMDLARLLRAMDRTSDAADLLYATALRYPLHPGLGEFATQSLGQLGRDDEAAEIYALLKSADNPSA